MHGRRPIDGSHPKLGMIQREGAWGKHETVIADPRGTWLKDGTRNRGEGVYGKVGWE